MSLREGNAHRVDMAEQKKKKSRNKRQETLEDKLLKSVDLSRVPAPTGPLITSSQIFAPLLEITRYYLTQHSHSDAARQKVAEMAFYFRKEAMLRFRHDTAETFYLASVMKPPQAVVNRGTLDAVSHIQRHPNMNMRLNVDQQAVAEHIQKIWRAFARGLGGGSGDLSRVGGSSQNLHPLDVMDQGLYDAYKKYWQPFYRFANKILISVGSRGESITVVTIVTRVLVEDIYPENLDRHYMLEPGVSLKVLHSALRFYHDPTRLAGSLKPKKQQTPPPTQPAGPSLPLEAMGAQPKEESQPVATKNAVRKMPKTREIRT